MKKGTVFKELLKYTWKNCKKLLFVALAESVLSAVCSLIGVLGIGIVIDALTGGGNISSVTRVIVWFVGVNLVVSVLRLIFSFLSGTSTRKATDAVQFDYIRDGVEVNYHWAQDGSVLDRKKNSMGANPVFLIAHIGAFVNYIVKFAGIIYLFSRLSPLFLVVVIATSALSVLLTFKRRKREFAFSNARTEDNRKLAYLYNLMTRYEYAKEIRINHADRIVIRKSESLIRAQQDKRKLFNRSLMRIDSLSALAAVVQSAAMYFYFSYAVYIGRLTIAEYTVLLAAVALLASILIGFFDNVARIDRMTAHMDIFLAYKEWMTQNSDIYATNRLPMPPIADEQNEIRFENVSFTYPDAQEPVLKGLDFVIKDGQKVGIVGVNGTGKTTLVKLLLRLYKPTVGTIYLNGVDINVIPLSSYLERIGAVLQDFRVFAYSVRENLVFDREVSQEIIDRAIGYSGFGSKLSALKNGLDTVLYKELDPNGIELSGGEGQKLSFARALCRNAGILILDEPTSTLDPLAEYEMFSGIRRFSEGRTTVFISHRLSSTKYCDRILVIENGQIAEDGTHDELMALGGRYAGMFATQAKYYRENEANYESNKR